MSWWRCMVRGEGLDTVCVWKRTHHDACRVWAREPPQDIVQMWSCSVSYVGESPWCTLLCCSFCSFSQRGGGGGAGEGRGWTGGHAVLCSGGYSHSGSDMVQRFHALGSWRWRYFTPFPSLPRSRGGVHLCGGECSGHGSGQHHSHRVG